jgi:hypothetical protein
MCRSSSSAASSVSLSVRKKKSHLRPSHSPYRMLCPSSRSAGPGPGPMQLARSHTTAHTCLYPTAPLSSGGGGSERGGDGNAEHMRPPCSEPCCRRPRQRSTKPARGTAGVCLCDQRGKAGATHTGSGGQFQMFLRTSLVCLLPRYFVRILICGKENIVAEAAMNYYFYKFFLVDCAGFSAAKDRWLRRRSQPCRQVS